MDLGLGDYLLGVAGLVAIAASLGFAATRARARLLPGWHGAPAWLADAILAIGALILISELLGLIGILTGVALVVACVAVSAAVIAWGRAAGGPRRERGGPKARVASDGASPAAPPPHKDWQLIVAAAISLLVAAQWAVPTLEALDRGIYGGDSLWYHMPFAAGFAQEGSITALHFTDPLYLNWFYPQNSELLHADALLLFGVDFLSPVLNLGWLGLALLAGWCVGRRYDSGAIGVAGVALLLSADLFFSRQPGNANNDVMGLALFLASIALLLNVRAPIRLPGLAVVGLAAGLALGTKLTFVVPVVALAVGVVAIARGERAKTALAFGGGLVAGGGFWYLRNLIAAGNPLPWTKLGIGPVALPRSEELQGRDQFSVADYLADGTVWREFFVPGLEERFGDLWPAVLALAAAGVIWALLRGGRAERMLAVVAAIATVAYLVTPLSASGPEGQPLGFRLNLRYLAPALAIGLVILAMVPATLRRPAPWRVGVLAVLVVLILVGSAPLSAFDDGHLAGALLLAAALIAAPVAAVTLARAGAPLAARLAVPAVLALGIAALGWAQLRDYEDLRYARAGYPEQHPGQELRAGLGSAYEWARGTREARIGVGGTTAAFFGYGLYGPDSSNEVRYVARRGPRGSLFVIESCPEWRSALNEGGYDFVVTSPDYDQDHPERRLPAPEGAWTAEDPAATPVAGKDGFRVFRIDGQLDPAACA